MPVIIKAVIGAAIVVVISLLAKTKSYFLAGMIPLFPTFAIISHVIVGQKGSVELRTTALFGMFSLIPYFIYLFSIYVFAAKVKLVTNIFISSVFWFISAFTVYLIWIKIKS